MTFRIDQIIEMTLTQNSLHILVLTVAVVFGCSRALRWLLTS